VVVVSLAAFALLGVAVATASAPSITGFPNKIKTVNLDGYVIKTSYPLGANTGFTFQQTYGATTVEAHPLPNPDDLHFNSNYVAMPVGHKMLMVTWFDDNHTITDVFVMNFKTGIVSDVAPVAPPGNLQSLGTVKVLHKGGHKIP
jgi:hypothetical protein